MDVALKFRFAYRAWRARLRDQRLEIALTRALVQRGDFVVDAGANKGSYVYWLRDAVGDSGKVFAYEPQPVLAAYLRSATETFRWPNVWVHEVALSNHSGSATLHVPGHGATPGASLESTVLDRTPGPGATFECKVNTLDAEIGGNSPLRFLKVDVEGHELAVFQGAERILRRDHPHILFECEERHLSKHTMGDVFSFLDGLGYEGFVLLDDSTLPIARFDARIHQARRGPEFWKQPGYHNNFLFVASGFPLGEVTRRL
jgi:FkbM family methyltransferase